MMATYSVEYLYRLRDQFSQQVKKIGAASRSAQTAVRGSGQAANSAAAGYRQMGHAATDAERRVRSLAMTMRAMRTLHRGGALGGFVGGGIGMYSGARVISQYANYEQKLLDIAKVYTGDKKNLPELYAGLKKLNRIIPLTRTEIATLLEEGLRANVSPDLNTQELIDYTKTASQFMVAFNLPVDQASKRLAKLKSSLGLTMSELTALGDTMNTVANKTSTNEAEMLEYVSRVGGLAKSIGGMRGLQDVMAIGAAQMAAGTAKEVAATGLRTLLVRLGTQPKTTKKALESLGFDPEDIKKRLPKDIFGTVREIMGRIAALPEAQRAAVLGELAGLKSFDAFARLFGNLDLLDQTRAHVEGQYRLRMIDEFMSRMKGLKSAIQLTSNVLADFGDSLVEYWRPTIAWGLAAISSLALGLEGNPFLAWAAGLYGLASALGLILLPLGMLIWSLGTIAPLLSVLLTPFKALAGLMWAAASGAVIGAWQGAAAALAPYIARLGLLRTILIAIRGLSRIGLILSIVGAGWWLIKNWDRISALLKDPTKVNIIFPEAPEWLKWLMQKGAEALNARESLNAQNQLPLEQRDLPMWYKNMMYKVGLAGDPRLAQAGDMMRRFAAPATAGMPTPAPNPNRIPASMGEMKVQTEMRGNIDPLQVNVTAPPSISLRLPNGMVAGSIPMGASSNAPRGVSAQDAGSVSQITAP